MSDDFFLSLDTLQDMIENVLDEYSDNDEYLPPNQVYNDIAWFYHAGVQDGSSNEIYDEIIDGMFYVSENWAYRDLFQLGAVFEEYFLTGYHGGTYRGDY